MKGIDYLGLGHPLYPIDLVCQLTPKGYAIGCFDQTFGDSLPNLKTLLASEKFPAYRIHIGWQDNHKLIPLDLLHRRAEVFERISLEHSKVKFYLSHTCEAKNYDLSHPEEFKKSIRERIKIIKKTAPHCVPIDCDISGIDLPNVIDEYHDEGRSHKRPYIVSMDGCGYDAAAKAAKGAWRIDCGAWSKLHRPALIRFYWIPELNLRTGAVNDPAPKDRKTPPTRKDIEELISITYETGDGR